jgi:hypothetical protein
MYSDSRIPNCNVDNVKNERSLDLAAPPMPKEALPDRAAAIDYFSSWLVDDYFCRLVDERNNVLFSS